MSERADEDHTRRTDSLDTSDAIDTTDTTDTSDASEATVTRHEERASYSSEAHEAGRIHVRKHVDTYPVEQVVSRSTEQADTSERIAADEGDTGEVETLPDGSISIPVFEEVLEVTKRLVVRERVIVRKHTVVDEHVLRTELRRERVEVDADAGVDIDDRRVDPA